MKIILLFCFSLLVVIKSYSQIRFDLKTVVINDTIKNVLASKFKSCNIVSIDSRKILDLAEKSQKSNRLQFSLLAEDSTMIFNLEPNDMRDEQYRSVITTTKGEIEEKRGVIKWFKGHVNNEKNQLVRLTIDKSGLEGFFIQYGKVRFIEPLRNHIPKSSSEYLIIYSAEEAFDRNTNCGATEIENYKSNLNMRASNSNAINTTNQSVRIATDADYSYYLKHKLHTNDHILGVINQVEGLYYQDFGLSFKVTFQNVYEIDNDPYNSTSSLTLLNQFKDYWNANRYATQRDIAFLFNSINLESGTVGRAFQGQVCVNRNSSYGFFSEATFSLESIITAHEIGHLFGADHESEEDCDDVSTLMCSSISKETSFEFSQVAKNSISSHINSSECLDTFLSVEIYPIPAYSSLFVESSEPDFSIILYDVLQKEVHRSNHTGNNTELSLTSLPNGFYIVTIVNANKVITKRIEILR